MTKRALKKTRQDAVAAGATASGATAVGAASLGAMALGAVALGALAVGALAIGRLRIGRARLGRVEIDELVVARLAIGDDDASGVAATATLRAAPGEGDAFERLVRERMAESGPKSLLRHLHRSASDPESFLLCASYVDEAAFEQDGQVDDVNALIRDAVAQGLLAARHASADLAVHRRLSPAD